MTFPVNSAARSPKGDHNRRLSLGIAPDVFAAEAGITPEELRAYEFTPPDGTFDVDIARRVGAALEMMEGLKSPIVDNGPTPPNGTSGRFEDVGVEAERDEDDTTDNPNPSPMNPAFP